MKLPQLFPTAPMPKFERYRVEPTDLDGPGCPCCGEDRARGYVYGVREEGDEVPLAVYAADWSGLGRYVTASLGLVVGPWTPEASAPDRLFIRWEVVPAGMSTSGLPDFRPAEAASKPFHGLEALGHPVSAADHPGQAADVLVHHEAVCRAVVAQDPRLSMLTLKKQSRGFQASGD